MQHLTLEALARLVDEPPAAAETEHLGACEACRAELEAIRADTAALGRLGTIEPAGAEWAALAARLEREGLLAGSATAAGTLARRWTPRLLRLAAALTLYAVGAASGLALRSRPATPVAVAPTPTPLVRTTTAPAVTGAAPEGAVAESPSGAANAEAPSETADVRLASTGPAELRPATPAEALRAVRTAEQQYLRAYARYAELTSGQQLPDDPIARVAALESIVLTTRQALDRAPADPLINGYHLTAVAQRDAALRQIALRSNGPWF